MLMSLPFEWLQNPLPGSKLMSRQGPRANRHAWHHGLDLSQILNGHSVGGGAVFPVMPGTVKAVCYYPDNCCGGYGNTVLVQHGDDLFSFYAHMDRIDVTEGQEVSWTTPLGIVGDKFADFRVEGCPRRNIVPHLHFEFRHADGSRYDVLHVLAAGGIKVGPESYIMAAQPFEYEEPLLVGSTEKAETFREQIVGSPVLRYGRWYTIGLPAGLALGIGGLTTLGIWLASRSKRT